MQFFVGTHSLQNVMGEQWVIYCKVFAVFTHHYNTAVSSGEKVALNTYTMNAYFIKQSCRYFNLKTIFEYKTLQCQTALSQCSLIGKEYLRQKYHELFYIKYCFVMTQTVKYYIVLENLFYYLNFF